jgi:hypothetical protein
MSHRQGEGFGAEGGVYEEGLIFSLAPFKGRGKSRLAAKAERGRV